MLQVIPATDRHHAAPVQWLNSYFLFSFADYYDRRTCILGRCAFSTMIPFRATPAFRSTRTPKWKS